MGSKGRADFTMGFLDGIAIHNLEEPTKIGIRGIATYAFEIDEWIFAYPFVGSMDITTFQGCRWHRAGIERIIANGFDGYTSAFDFLSIFSLYRIGMYWNFINPY
jgi:hypothetical protein